MNKVCSNCRQEKNVTEFYAPKRPHCKGCERTSARQRMMTPENRLRTAFRGAKRTAEKHSTYDDLTLDDVRYVFAISDGKCAYCGKHDPDNLHLEHIAPLSRNGHNTLSNITTSCPACNLAKRTEAILTYISTNSFDANLINVLIDKMAYRADVDRNEIIDLLRMQQDDYRWEDNEDYIRRYANGDQANTERGRDAIS